MEQAPWTKPMTADSGSACSIVALQRADGPGRVDTGTQVDWDRAPEDVPGKIVCKTCGTIITSDEMGISINGSHEHTFMNPGGLVFRIGCFSGAGGCRIMGIPTSEYTWFPGFAWCFVICSGCLSHLGWHYDSGGSSFFGFILDELARG